MEPPPTLPLSHSRPAPTDGMPLSRFERVSVQAVIMDEAHERSVESDLLLAALRELMRSQRKLKLVLMRCGAVRGLMPRDQRSGCAPICRTQSCRVRWLRLQAACCSCASQRQHPTRGPLAPLLPQRHLRCQGLLSIPVGGGGGPAGARADQ